jgi:hypothetical protein
VPAAIITSASRRLACDPAMRAIVGRESMDRPATSASQMGRFETEWLASEVIARSLMPRSRGSVDLAARLGGPRG